MDIQTFDKLVERETKRMKDVMCSKSADYADGTDKLFNFKLAAELDGISPIEALRGMWLKHRTSIRQGLDELLNDKGDAIEYCRSEDWWIEKLTDDRNYSILFQALLIEKYFKFVCPAGWAFEQRNHCGWRINNLASTCNNFLWKDFTMHRSNTGWDGHKHGEAPGYWPTKGAAEAALEQYLEKQK